MRYVFNTESMNFIYYNGSFITISFNFFITISSNYFHEIFCFPKNKIITSKGLHILKSKYIFEKIQLIIIVAMFLVCITDGFLLMFICTKSICHWLFDRSDLIY